jgi:hypothetical protein
VKSLTVTLYRLHFTIHYYIYIYIYIYTHTHTSVQSHVFTSRCSVAAFKRQTFSFLWVLQLSCPQVSGQFCHPRRFILKERATITHSIRKFWTPKAGLNTTEKRKYLALSEIESGLLGYTAGSLVYIATELSWVTFVFYWQRGTGN